MSSAAAQKCLLTLFGETIGQIPRSLEVSGLQWTGSYEEVSLSQIDVPSRLPSNPSTSVAVGNDPAGEIPLTDIRIFA